MRYCQGHVPWHMYKVCYAKLRKLAGEGGGRAPGIYLFTYPSATPLPPNWVLFFIFFYLSSTSSTSLHLKNLKLSREPLPCQEGGRGWGGGGQGGPKSPATSHAPMDILKVTNKYILKYKHTYKHKKQPHYHYYQQTLTHKPANSN